MLARIILTKKEQGEGGAEDPAVARIQSSEPDTASGGSSKVGAPRRTRQMDICVCIDL